jgi:hypothetical protein
MGNRKPISRTTEQTVLTASRRKCCLCVFLHDRNEVRKGQIAHLNHDATDSRFENLVFLCLEHHDDYDGTTSQSKGFMVGEVREYRDRLYRRQGYTAKTRAKPPMDTADLPPLPEITQYEKLRQRFPTELSFTDEPWRYSLWQVANEPDFFAYKSHGSADGICLIERIDLPDGRIVIACIQTEGNPGTSITNSVESICFQVCERFDIPAERLVWLEHYDDNHYKDWSMVLFEQKPPDSPFRNPKWIDMTPHLWGALGLKPRKKLEKQGGGFISKLTKLFDWPTQAILD